MDKKELVKQHREQSSLLDALMQIRKGAAREGGEKLKALDARIEAVKCMLESSTRKLQEMNERQIAHNEMSMRKRLRRPLGVMNE